MKARRNLINLFMLAVAVGCGRDASTSQVSERWDDRNDPIHFESSFNYTLADLPLKAKVTKKAWADSYWPSYMAGIADRWNSRDEYDPFTYTPPDLEAVRQMSEEELRALSPAEKYEIFIGNYNYDLVKHERERNSPEDESWFGLCHGWAPAAINYEEPKPVTVEGANGIQIPFGSSDIKALLTFHQHLNRPYSATRFLGGRCNEDLPSDPDADVSPECRDINAGTFHVVITNMIGLNDHGFVADVTRDTQVWNQPIEGYQSIVLEESNEVYESAAPGTEKIVTVETRMTYTQESGAKWDSTSDLDPFPYHHVKLYKYHLELDENGVILGGEWVTNSRPDFLWLQSSPPFRGYLAELQSIYEKSIQSL